jgi:hypothetical protein
MVVTEKIQKYVQKLPSSLQSEVLDYVEYLLAKAGQETGRQEESAWSDLSLSAAMRGLENEANPGYSTSDLKVDFR